jgi:Protein kinase domain
VSTPFDGDLKRYKLGNILGAPGGFGTAYTAEHANGLQCVVKLFHGFSASSPQDRRRLGVMLAKMQTVRSQNVVEVVDSGFYETVEGPRPWIAMPRLHGAVALDQWLRMNPVIDMAWSHRVLREITAGLAALHEVGLLHRDLKPSNVLVDRRGRAWLIDFDLVKVQGVMTETPAGDRLGTLAWMAPEQTVGPVGPEADLWALGLVAHELLTRRQPLLAHALGGPPAILAAIAAAPLVGVDVPPPYNRLIDVLLRKVPAARPDSAARVGRWLDDPDGVLLERDSVIGRVGLRWAAGRREEIDAVELARRDEITAEAIDVTVRAREDVPRLRRAAAALSIPFAHEPAEQTQAAASPETLFTAPAAGDPVEHQVMEQLKITAGTGEGFALLPFDSVDQVGVTAAVHRLRVGVRHRDLAGGKPLVGTVHCTAELLADPIRALQLLAACSALGVDGWRLWVDGLQPGCSAEVTRSVRDAALTLGAGGQPVWVRASGVHRWALAATGVIGVGCRAGRGLWTRVSMAPQQVPERVEIDRLAGPVPREIAERIELWRPDLVQCSCRACEGRGLPSQGVRTVLHNVLTVGRQLSGDLTAEAILDRLDDAFEQRALIAESVDWKNPELKDLTAVRAAVSDYTGGRTLGPRFLQAS